MQFRINYTAINNDYNRWYVINQLTGYSSQLGYNYVTIMNMIIELSILLLIPISDPFRFCEFEPFALQLLQ